ncbi:hypothetical protein [Acinetobacter sp. A47]|uniref:hypothetical protein n=1 Tax=Acinetobacter sp. A47 TaxID=1561217 RepID=UPI0005705E7E|nr:hypothetical protein [Acinetobacter sp. A47]
MINDTDVMTWSGRTQEDKNKERISLLDYNANYNNGSEALNNALSDLSNKGGGILYIPYHTGTLTLNNTIILRNNVTVICDKNLKIDCRTLTSGYSFIASGSIEIEIPLARSLTSGDTSVLVSTKHNFKVGDYVLLKSQRECAHQDAGDTWRLGETTAGAKSPFFGEPLQIHTVPSDQTFTIYNSIIFPDYLPDNTKETSPTARPSSTVQKINLLKGVKWLGGIFLKEKGSLFKLEYCISPEIEIEVIRGYGSGTEINIQKSLYSIINAKVSRPNDWSLNGNSHSSFNSIKDTSSWYSKIYLEEINGSQCLDQTYIDLPCLYPEYNVKSINSHEDGMTTHGCSYGALINLVAINCNYYALRNRTRFSRIKVQAINCNGGVYMSTWGAHDCELDVDIHNFISYGIFIKNMGVNATSGPFKNIRIPGYLRAASNVKSYGISIVGYDDPTTLDSGVNLNNLKINNCYRAISTGAGINGIILNNINIDDVGLVQPIYLRQSSGHKISNIFADLSNQPINDSNELVLMSTFTGSSNVADYGSTVSHIDYSSCRIINGRVLPDIQGIIFNKRIMKAVNGINDVFNIGSKNLSLNYCIEINSNEIAGNCRIVLSNSIPLGCSFNIYIMANTILINPNIGVYGLDGATIYFTGSKSKFIEARFINVSEMIKIEVIKVDNNKFVVVVP